MLNDVLLQRGRQHGLWWDFQKVTIFIHFSEKAMAWIENLAERERIKVKAPIIMYFNMEMCIFCKREKEDKLKTQQHSVEKWEIIIGICFE